MAKNKNTIIFEITAIFSKKEHYNLSVIKGHISYGFRRCTIMPFFLFTNSYRSA